MPSVETEIFGILDYEESMVIEFRAGLPAFEQDRRFVLLRRSDSEPFVFLQSLDHPAVVFVAIPVQRLDPAYRLAACEEDLRMLGLNSDDAPGRELTILAIVTIPEEGVPTANLMAPLLINPATQKGVQAVPSAPEYSHEHRLWESEAACS